MALNAALKVVIVVRVQLYATRATITFQ
jgi:hypothetical protein